MTEAVLLDEFAEFHIVVGSHRDGPVTANGAICLCAHEIERSDADMSRTFRVARFPWLGVHAEEQGERTAEHAQQCAGHL